jgi:uncharacterized protein
MIKKADIAELRSYAVARTLFAPRDLEGAIRALGFVQLDPIRAPARAQDLILRHRVADYRNGDLDRGYAGLPVAEDHLHVYGVLPRDTQRLLYPRMRHARWHVEREHPRLAARILAHVRDHGPTHPRDLQRALTDARIVNGWGGQSSATTRMLEVMQYRGMLRVAHRVNGIRVYEAAPSWPPPLTPAERATGLLRLLVRLYAPVPAANFRALSRVAMGDSMSETARIAAVERFLDSEWLARMNVDGVAYVHPADESLQTEPDAAVRLLAPFDPIVWDRKRFQHFWGWAYRFEAYTPPARRQRGYYALPLLWRGSVIGWANVAVERGVIDIDIGFIGRKPRDVFFRRELDAEIARMASFLGVSDGGGAAR